MLGLKSRVEGATALADTVVQEFEIGLRYRWNILRKASSPVLRFGLDYGSMSFTIEDPQIALPNIAYSYLKVAAVGIDRGENAALLALEILALKDAKLSADLKRYRREMADQVEKDSKEVEG